MRTKNIWYHSIIPVLWSFASWLSCPRRWRPTASGAVAPWIAAAGHGFWLCLVVGKGELLSHGSAILGFLYLGHDLMYSHALHFLQNGTSPSTVISSPSSTFHGRNCWGAIEATTQSTRRLGRLRNFGSTQGAKTETWWLACALFHLRTLIISDL